MSKASGLLPAANSCLWFATLIFNSTLYMCFWLKQLEMLFVDDEEEGEKVSVTFDVSLDVAYTGSKTSG